MSTLDEFYPTPIRAAEKGDGAMVLILTIAFVHGPSQALHCAEPMNYTEPLFVSVVMVIAGLPSLLGFVSMSE